MVEPSQPERDLGLMLSSLRVERRPGTVSVVSAPPDQPDGEVLDALESAALATVREREGRTFVVPAEAAASSGLPVIFDGVWLTVNIWTALDSVGLTAALSDKLASAGIACNVFAGAFHDHLLVPVDAADRAVELLRSQE